MAGGYLGKISAVISANTGDYVRGLNEGAKATRDFAKTVQSTLNRSASEAAKAFEGIYTPLQQFERAIRQAGQLRLNFKGFEGAVKNINDLQKRLNGVLTNNEIDLVVRTSGLRDIEAVRQAINSLSEKEITLSANAGGLPGLLKARAELERSGAGATTIINTKATQAELDALIEKLNVLDDRKIDLIIDVVNQRGLEEAITRARRLQDVATQIAAPLAVASAEFAKLSQSAQGQFAPALGAAQRAVEQFKADIDQLGPAGRRAFQELKADVDLVRASISRLSEVQSLTGGLFTGRELTFVNPEVVDTLNRLQAAQRQLASAPAAVRGSPIGQEVVADAQVLQEQLNRVLARVERIRAEGGQITFSQRGLDVILQRLRQVTEETSQVSSEPVRVAASARGAEDDEIARLVNRERAALERDRAEQRTFPAREGDPQGAFGPSFQPFIENLRRDIAATRIDLERLDGPLREQLGPEVTRINNQFGLLARQGIATSADEARRLSREIAAINTSFANRRNIGQEFSQRFGGAGAAGLGLGVDQRSLNAVGGQIEFVQQRLAKLGAEARGPTLEALQRFRAVAQRLFDAGTIDTEGGRRELEALRRELAQTLSAAGGGSSRSITQGLSRAGDVARGGFDRFSLGIQQAAFAVEDFFSVTGGLDQRVRAAGNNISQLGFILGGTSGLIAGIAGAIGSQLIVALIKWANAGRTTEDQIKALNDSLSRQRSLVEELAQAFRSLGDSIGRNAFSASAKDADEFGRALDDIRKKQRELRDQRAFSLDEGVLRARADVNVAENRLSRASTRDEAVAAQRQLRESRERLRQEENRVRNRPEQTLDAARARANDIFTRFRDTNADRAAATAAATGGGAGAAQGARQIAFAGGEAVRRRVAAQLAGANDAGTVRNVLRGEQAQAAARGDDRLVAQLEELINSLEEPINRATDALANKVLEGADKVGQSLERARAAVDDALSAGVAGAQGFSSQINEANRGLRAALTQLEQSLSIEDDAQRQAAVAAAEQAVKVAQRQANSLDEQRKSVEAATDAVNRFADALQSITRIADQNLSSAESRRDRAREEFLARPTLRNNEALGRAEADVRRQEELRNNARREAALAEERARQDPQAQADARRIREIDQLLSTTGVLADGQRERLIAEREDLRARSERRSRDTVDNDPRLRAARDASIREEQRQQMVAEGRNLRLTDGQRAAEELAGQIAATQAESAQRIAEAIKAGRFNDIGAIQGDQRRTEARLRDDAARQQAPAIFALADSVQNALLQGPSRAALAPTDVSTVEGSRELTRLLRGDDAARNQDLVQLQRQSVELLRVIANNPAPVAN